MRAVMLAADPDWLRDVTDVALPFAAAVLLIGWLVGSFRRGKSDAAREALDFATAEILVLREANTRMSGELNEARAELARLGGLMEQLREENAELRRLVMLEKIPPALEAAMSGASGAVLAAVTSTVRPEHDRVIAAIVEELHPIAQGVARLLRKSVV